RLLCFSLFIFLAFFFFSSRRRHTSFSRDWSSDVCSSDLVIYPPLESAPLVGRLTVYVAVLYAIEYTAGWLLRCALGRCPWDYGRARWSVHGLIRLDYLPAWAAACLIFESLWLELRVL